MNELIRRRALMGKKGGILPPEYQQVEYITPAADNISIDTGFVVNTSTDELYARAYFTSEAGGVFFCYGGGNLFFGFRSYLLHQVSAYNHNFILDGHRFSITLPTDDYADIYISNSKIKINESEKDTTIATLSGSLCVFGEIQFARSRSRFIWGKIVRNSQTAIELIPCVRKSDGEVGVYDIVGKQFHSKTSGEGNFIAGPNV